METIASPLLWTIFTIFVLGMLALDLGVFSRRPHEVRFREALTWSAVWVALSLLFNGWIYLRFGSDKALEFLTGYLIEKALSVDNIFIFIVLFAAFAVPKIYEHRVLFWGVIGAIVLRAIFIGIGAALITRFHWVLYVFGAILIVTGVRLLMHRNEPVDVERNPLFRFARRVLPARFATPFVLALIAIETTDIVFAVDSIPAIFAVTEDPFIVYTSNIFAILGMRAMYFLLAGIIPKFHLLKAGLALVLMFVGAKMAIADFVKIPIAVSLGVIAVILGGSVAASLLSSRPLENPTDGAAGSPDPRATRAR